jgi:ABC-type multidrug transport system ATPase subunit
VGSFDTLTQMSEVHTILGVCPQFDTVWADLSVQEHLLLFARLKGVTAAEERGLTQSVAEAIKLDGDPFGQSASQLSGGMMRRLSLGIALIADPQVVLLDEPSTGLDPETRRVVWDIVEHEREKGRCIILTTHSMEEADTLCTRIGIMAQGRLRSLGTSAELKRRHGQGYRLTFTLARSDAEVNETTLRSMCPSAELVYSFGKNRTYVLPTEETDLAGLFEHLVEHKDALGVREWGLSQATLEEAFIRIATLAGTR